MAVGIQATSVGSMRDKLGELSDIILREAYPGASQKLHLVIQTTMAGQARPTNQKTDDRRLTLVALNAVKVMSLPLLGGLSPPLVVLISPAP